MGRKSKAALAEEKGIKDAITSIINKVNGVMETYGQIKDTIHVVQGLYRDEELMALVGRIKDGEKDPKMYILLAAAILRVLKEELENNDGVFDYVPPVATPAEPATPATPAKPA